MTMAFALVLGAVAIVISGLAFAKIQRKQKGLRPLKAFAQGQEVLYRLPVAVKYKLGSGWSIKTLAGMEVVIRSGVIGVSMTAASLGETLGSDWMFRAPETTIEVSGEPSHGIRIRQWIVLTGTEQDKSASLAISSTDRLGDIWRALVDAGARATSGPPSAT